jgi:3-deoxy-7-phosphoheptulonate synthase
VRIRAVRPLLTPALLEEWLPVPPEARRWWKAVARKSPDVLHGRDDRLVVVVGPCSIHDHDQAMTYAHLLKAEADR